MPIFEYVCEDCRKPFETLVYRDEKVECPSCHSEHLSKQFSTFGVSSSSDSSCDSSPMYQSGMCGGNPDACGCKN